MRTYNDITVAVEERGGKPIISGYAAVFFRQDEPGTEFELYPGLVERVGPDAFDRHLSDGGDCRALFNHDSNQPLGRLSAGTLRLEVDKRGLRYEIDAPETQWGRDVVTSIKRGDVGGSSFGFSVRKVSHQMGDGFDVRVLEDVELVDVSPVVFPAYGSTSTQARSIDSDQIRADHEKWRKVQKRLQEIKDGY